MITVVENTNQYSSQMRKYYYDGSHIIAELDGSNNLLASYTHSPLTADDIIGARLTHEAVEAGLSTAQGQVYYLKDHLGSVNEVVNANGSIIQKMEYGAFGQLRSVKNSSNEEVSFESAPVRTSFTYTGREFEPELGMYYYRARYYDPSVGRFLQQDPDPGKLIDPQTIISKYNYANNNPVMNNDPTGKFWVLAAMFGAFGKDIQRIAIIGTAFVAGLIGGPIVAAALLGAGAGAVTFAIVSTVAGAAIGGVTGGLGYTSGGLGTFQEGFQAGAAAGAIGGLVGGIGLYGSRQEFLNFANDVVYRLSFSNIKSSFPLGANSALTATLFLAGFTYDQIKKSCNEGSSYDWKTNKCKSGFEVPIPIPDKYQP
jgi:RHS repeat-associated protein